MASRIASRYLASILRTPKTISPPLLRPHPRLPRTLQPVGCRFAHAIPKPTPPPSPNATKTRKQLEPHYELTFTCAPCGERSSHTVSKQGYHHGSVLITCPGCRNRHIMSDHLNIFGDRKITVEDLLREKGQLVKRGTLGEDGDIEFWEDTPADSAGAGRTGTASQGKRGEEEDEARRLRETLDPSSKATDPTPSTLVLAGDTGTRPSVQGVSQQSPTPSTRRQYHTKSFKPERKRDRKELKAQRKRGQGEFKAQRKRGQGELKAQRKRGQGELEALREREARNPTWQTLGEPARKGQTAWGYWEDQSAQEESRQAESNARSDYFRFVAVKDGRGVQMSVQLRPFDVFQRRPPGGIPEEVEGSPDPPRSLAQRRGFSRPVFLQVIPNNSSRN